MVPCRLAGIPGNPGPPKYEIVPGSCVVPSKKLIVPVGSAPEFRLVISSTIICPGFPTRKPKGYGGADT
jgi:hypothetical protein